jgi:hypothetical protein
VEYSFQAAVASVTDAFESMSEREKLQYLANGQTEFIAGLTQRIDAIEDEEDPIRIDLVNERTMRTESLDDALARIPLLE